MSHQNPYTISPIAAAVSAALVTPAATLAQEEGASDAIENIIVTASKRAQNIQDIPTSVQAIPEAMLKDMGALSTEDYARFIPSMVWRKTSGGGGQPDHLPRCQHRRWRFHCHGERVDLPRRYSPTRVPFLG